MADETHKKFSSVALKQRDVLNKTCSLQEELRLSITVWLKNPFHANAPFDFFNYNPRKKQRMFCQVWCLFTQTLHRERSCWDEDEKTGLSCCFSCFCQLDLEKWRSKTRLIWMEDRKPETCFENCLDWKLKTSSLFFLACQRLTPHLFHVLTPLLAVGETFLKVCLFFVLFASLWNPCWQNCIVGLSIELVREMWPC